MPLIITILFNFNIFLLCFLLLIYALAYSAPPLRVKGRPGLDLIWHFFGFFILFMWGSYFAGSIRLINWVISISFGIEGCITLIQYHIKDSFFDEKTGTNTFVVWAGIKNSKNLLKIFQIVQILTILYILFKYCFNYTITIVIFIVGIVIGIIYYYIKKISFYKFFNLQFRLIFIQTSYICFCIYYILFLINLPTIWSP